MELLRKGKVREVYADGDDVLLVASDRVSVYDVVLPTPIPDKGAILTQLSLWWFRQLSDLVPNRQSRVWSFRGVWSRLTGCPRRSSLRPRRRIRGSTTSS